MGPRSWRAPRRSSSSGCDPARAEALRPGGLVDIGEFELIGRIRKAVGSVGPATIVGIGDDAAVLESPDGLLLLTCDAFVEGVHFRRDFSSLWEIGAKCMIANVSDIAAMGGFPRKAVVSLCIPDALTADDISALYDGMLDACVRYDAEIVGGDVVSSNNGLVVSVALTGVVEKSRVVTRSGAVEGDQILVTGELGGAQAGLRALEEGLPDEGLVPNAKKRHRLPEARLAEAHALVDVATPMAMIDISDGLALDLRHIASESGVGVRVWQERIPVAAAAREIANRLGCDPLEFALYGGEEFELVVTIPASEVERTVEHVKAVTGTAVTPVGEVVSKAGGCTIIGPTGEASELKRRGYEHFA